ncbi:hypothetical protein [Acetobacter syzygii]
MIHVRTPLQLKAQMQRSADQNRRSLNAEIVVGLEFYALHLEQTKKAPGHVAKQSPDASSK